jgi:hypothetical protein
MSDRTPAQMVTEALEPFLGRHTAATAVRTFAERSLGLAVDKVQVADVPRLLAALGPTLAALLGSAKAEQIARGLEREVSAAK